jgi:2-octaprenylphenol hydroxylase
MNRPQSYDVVIAGGGMVGAALACALGGSQLRVAVIESAPLARIRPGTEVDLRVSAITCASQRLFSAVGAWQPMTAWRVSPFRDMRVWDAAGPGRIHFDSAAIGEPLLGWIIENRVIQYTLLERARTLDNVDLLCPRSLSLVTLRDTSAHVQLDDDHAFHTRLLVGADGAGSRVRRWSDIATEGWSYDQTAVVATVSTEQFHAETAWQRFLPTGPLAFLPLQDGRCSIVWSTSPAQAEHLLRLNEGDFAVELAQAFERRLGAVTGMTARGAFPLRLQHARAYVKPRVALIGDAAHVVHPLAGQGVNLGLMDAAALAEVLLDASADGKDIGSLKVLRRYERWRRGENLLMLGMLDGFKRLFGSTLTPVRLLRNLGLNAADAAAPIKNLMARRAMGLSGDLPRLARGFRGQA